MSQRRHHVLTPARLIISTLRDPVRQRLRLGAAAGLVSALSALVLVGVSPSPALADGEVIVADPAVAIEGSYLVILEESAADPAQASAALTGSYGGQVVEVFADALQGFSVRMNAAQAAEMAADPLVELVEQDSTVQLHGIQSNPPSWGLDRIDERILPMSNTYAYPNTARNVTAYILDTGIRTTHQTFGGRAVFGANFAGGVDTDCSGHGTHVAGTVGGAEYGVAKRVNLISVKVLSCSGSGSVAGIVAGINWVTAHHQPGRPAVVNMSLGGQGIQTAMRTAIANSIADGITYVVAAGNSDANACNFSPAGFPDVITVSASTITDARASFSNYGTCTEIFAPGENIPSAWITSDTDSNTISGTSMAAPHVTGAAALRLSTHPNATPSEVAAALLNNATTNRITNPGTGSPNRLLFIPCGLLIELPWLHIQVCP